MAFSPFEGTGKFKEDVRRTNLALFRNSIKACTLNNRLLLTVNFNRKTLGQTGFGHFSPVAAFNERRNMALILDVAKFKYDSYWCSVDTLF